MSEFNDLYTIRDFIRWTVSQFNAAGLYYGHGTETAWDEAIALIFHTLHLQHDIHEAVLDARLTQSEKQAINQLVQRRIHDRIPLPYLTKEAWFGGHSFYVDERVLIPRSPLAELINSQFEPWIQADQVHRILDLCTGSGCIAIACAKAFPDSLVDASDISQEALAVAKINLLRHDVEDQVHLYLSDLWNDVPHEEYDIIVSNPPYVSHEEMTELPKEYLHEPKLGLTAGELGLDFAIRILSEAHRYLSKNGILIVEVGNSEVALAELFPDIPFTWLEFENGGGGVFTLTKEQLLEAQPYLQAAEHHAR